MKNLFNTRKPTLSDKTVKILSNPIDKEQLQIAINNDIHGESKLCKYKLKRVGI